MIGGYLMALQEPDKYILSIDQGTLTTRAMIFNHKGFKVAETERPLKSFTPQPGWMEHEANEIWNAVQQVIATILINTSIQPQNIAAIGITNQRETTVVWNKNTGEPIYHAIGWQSQQSSKIVDDLIKNGEQQKFRDKTGLNINTYFSATKIRWILDHVDGAQKASENGDLLFGTIDSWIAWKLSDGATHVTDYSNASRTMLFNIHTLEWDQELLDLMNIPLQMMPTVRSSSEIYATTQTLQFYGASVPISGMAGDQQAALFGQAGFEVGNVKNTYGPGSFIIMNTGSEPQLSDSNLITTIAYGVDGKITYGLEGSIFVAGQAVDWLQDNLGMINNAFESREAALASTNNDEVYVVPAFNGLGSPYWDPDARGSVFGLTRGTNKNDFIKATLQSIAYQTKDVVETMVKDTGLEINTLKADGGASRNTYLMQFQADILNIEIDRAAEEDTTALGVAFLAGLAVGYWKDTDELKAIIADGKIFKPAMEESKRKTLYSGWKNAISATQLFKPLNNTK